MFEIALIALQEAIQNLKDRSQRKQTLSDEQEKQKEVAFTAVMTAIVATKAYLRDLKDDENLSSRQKELELSDLWLAASESIRKIDRQLFKSAQVKALAWADRDEWAKAQSNASTVKLDDLLAQVNHLRDQ